MQTNDWFYVAYILFISTVIVTQLHSCHHHPEDGNTSGRNMSLVAI